jgi:hypothetical protein
MNVALSEDLCKDLRAQPNAAHVFAVHISGMVVKSVGYN